MRELRHCMEKLAYERTGRGALTPLAGVEDQALSGPQAKHEQVFHERFEHQPPYRILDYQTLADSDRGLRGQPGDVMSSALCSSAHRALSPGSTRRASLAR
jgi:hypothetical protein